MATASVRIDASKPVTKWCLVLVDPLLNGSRVWELEKPETTVGFTEGDGVDIVIPWEDMGIDAMHESWRLDPGHNDALRNSLLQANFLFDPEFHMLFTDPGFTDPESCTFKITSAPDGGRAALARGENGIVLASGKWKLSSSLRTFRFETIPNKAGMSRESDGSFKFIWNSPAYVVLNSNHPEQAFRFMIMEKPEENEKSNDDVDEETKEEKQEEIPMLLRLPPLIRAQIAGNLQPPQLMDTLLMTSDWVLDSFRGEVRWKELVLTENYDSLRACALAARGALTSLKCRDPWDLSLRNTLWPKWKPLVAGRQLEKLVVADVALLAGVELSPRLKEFGVRATKVPTQAFGDVVFPKGVRALALDFIIVNRELSDFGLKVSEVFPAVETLTLCPCPEALGWGDAFRSGSLLNIKNLSVTMTQTSYVPLKLLKNLQILHYFNCSARTSLMEALSGIHLSRLTSLVVVHEGLSGVDKGAFWAVVAASLPALKYLEWNDQFFEEENLAAIRTHLPRLEQLVVGSCAVSVGEILVHAAASRYFRIATTMVVYPEDDDRLKQVVATAPRGQFFGVEWLENHTLIFTHKSDASMPVQGPFDGCPFVKL